MTVMPPFPARGSMDWHTDLKTYLDAIQSRGDLPDGADLNEVHGMQWVGSWQIRGSSSYANLPDGFPSGVSAALEVVYGGNVGTVHRVTVSNADGSVSGFWWREVALYNPGPEITWSPWQKNITSETVGRIITSPDYEHPLGEGDLLVVTPSQTFFEDFAGDPLGAAPAGWTQQWIQSEWEIVADASAQGGKVLRGAGGSGTARRAIRWDEIGTVSDVEVVIRHRAGTTESAGRPLVRAGGGVGAEECYQAIVQSSNYSLDKLTPTLRLDTIAHPIPWEQDAWFVTRLRVTGNRVKAKVWPSSMREPEEWTLSAVDSSHTSGWVGIQRFGAAALDIDWIGVAVGGGLAPVGRL